MGFMFPAHGNLGRFGNSAAWWLGIQPYELFFYVFLPPLLLDAAVRIDFFLFKKARHCALGGLYDAPHQPQTGQDAHMQQRLCAKLEC